LLSWASLFLSWCCCCCCCCCGGGCCCCYVVPILALGRPM
jgi:hypothetical protein